MMPPDRPVGKAASASSEDRPLLFVVANSHLDTQWRWTVRDTIREYLPATLRENFARFEKFACYRLSFEGAFRYMLMREYYPRDYEELKRWVEAGRWAPAGSMLDAPDVNLASPESLLRHILYANNFFEREFGRRCNDLFLPDGFGFGFALPTLAAHCGLIGFSSQKFIKWMAPAETPFVVGLWRGPDGNGVVAVLDPEGYGFGIDDNLARSARWLKRFEALDKRSGLRSAYKYYGLGDRGGAVDEPSIGWLEKSLEGGPIRVVSATSGEYYEQLTDEQIDQLPEHRGELLLPTHGTGCLTSQAEMKRLNRANEQLAEAAERAAADAYVLGARDYPSRRLEEAWIRFLWHQSHDDLTGTSIPEAYELSRNDEIVALNQFADVLTDSIESIAARLDTDTVGSPLVVYNALGCEREDLVRARLPSDPAAQASLRVFDGEGNEVPSQARGTADGGFEISFVARVPPLSLSVFEVRQATEPCAIDTGLSIGNGHLAGPHLAVELDEHFDLARLEHRASGHQVLRSPARLELLRDRSLRWPAWEIRFEEIARQPVATSANGRASVRVLESGPAAVALEVGRQLRRSAIRQRLRIAAGDAGRRLEIETRIDWRTGGHLLKAAFPLVCASEEATYDLGCGTVRRGTNRRSKYEVPAQQWADLSSPATDLGVSILTNCRYGWDHPDAETLRLSLLRSPRTYRKFLHQARQDFGLHELTYALLPHSGSWSDSAVCDHAARLNQPLRVFRTERHPGTLGRRRSLMQLSSDRVAVRALKKAEQGEHLVMRLQETRGGPVTGLGVSTSPTVVECRELDGSERPREAGQRPDLERLAFAPYEIRTLGLRLDRRPIAHGDDEPLSLPYDREVTSFHHSPPSGAFDAQGRSLAGELLEPSLAFRGVRFELGPLAPGQANAVTCRGQVLQVPAGGRLWLLAAAAGSDVDVRFGLGERQVGLTIQSYAGLISGWRAGRFLGLRRRRSGPIKRAPIAWLGSHRHDRRGRDEPYVFCYLFAYRLEIPSDCSTVRLPEADSVRLLAATALREPPPEVRPAADLY